MPEVPRGTVAFLFTDIEGSTRLWQTSPEAMTAAYARHDAILRKAIATQHGEVFKVIGDAFQAAFPTPGEAVTAALHAQRDLASEDWRACGLPEPLRIRMAVHVGEVDPSPDGDYRSPLLNRLGRLLGVGHGGQILLSQETVTRLRDALPPEASLRDLGERRLKDLHGAERIWQLLHPGLPTDFPPLATLDRRPHNLPVQTTPLLGRESAVQAIRQLLERRDDGARLVTLLGPGGIGKTRLALQVAAETIDVFNHGAFWVELATVTDAALVPAAIAQVLGVTEDGGHSPVEGLHEYLRSRETLLVLDNLEQLVAAAPLVANLLAAAPGLRILTTSRERLGIRGEQIVPVEPLAMPPRATIARLDTSAAEQYTAVQLFRERARAVKPGFTLTDETARAVAEICWRLDGLPLAIELAAARIRLFSPVALLARLEPRLPLLTGGARDLPERQQTLRNAIAWSYDLLSPQEQSLFRRLAIFAGGFTLDAAESVTEGERGKEGKGERKDAGDAGVAPTSELQTPPTVSSSFPPFPPSVIDAIASLVDKSLVRQSDDGSDEPRFGMFETIREFGLEQLAATGEADTAGAAHAAVFLALAERAEPELTGPAQRAWVARLEREHDNVRAAMTWLLGHGDAERALRLGGALWRFWSERAHLSEGRAWLERALAAGQDAPAPARARALYAAAVLAEDQGDYDQAVTRHVAALALWQTLGDRHGVARALTGLGNIAHDRGDYTRASERHEAALALAQELDDRRLVSVSLASLGTVAYYRGDLDDAVRYYEQSLAHFRALGDTHGTSRLLDNLGVVVARQGNRTRAIALGEESLALARELGNPTAIASGLINLGAAMQAAGNDDDARARYEEALALLRETGDRRHTAVALINLASIARGRDLARAAALFGESLALSALIGDRVSSAECWVNLASIAAARGCPERAARLLGAAAAVHEIAGAALEDDLTADRERLMVAARDALGEAACAAAWETGRALSFDAAVAEAQAVAEEWGEREE